MLHRSPLVRPIDPAQPDPDVLEEAAGVLRNGELVGFPTDTLYGIAADPRRRDAIERVYDAKGRRSDLAIPLIAASVDQVELVGRLTRVGRQLAREFWPGPLTLVVTARSAVPRVLCGGRDTVAVRVPDHSVAVGLALAFGYPVTATSANRSGAPSGRTAEEVVTAVGAALRLVLDAGPSPRKTPSTIVDVSGDIPVLVREGAVAWDRVLTSIE